MEYLFTMILQAEYHLKQIKYLTKVMVSQQTLQNLSELMNKHLNFLLHVPTSPIRFLRLYLPTYTSKAILCNDA